MPDHVRMFRALISVSDKTRLVEFARALARHGVELVSTGGTRKALADAGLPALDVSDLTGFPEMMDGRVKTLHPGVHGALLAVRDNEEHAAAMAAHAIRPIDLLVVNLYPFEATVAQRADFDTCIENIDIGGPAMIRAAAKNHAHVAVVVDPADYVVMLQELGQHNGMTTLALRRKLAAKAYARTAVYDAAISGWFAQQLEEAAPPYRAVGGSLIEPLRYGENPHQSAAFYRTAEVRPGVATARQVQGKQLSYNNINDTDAAYECVAEFDAGRTAACVIIKHANPCGAAEGASLMEAYRKALACDPVSAFGGIVAVNRVLDAEAARAITEIFTEVIIAPDASEEAIAIVAAKKNLRLLLAGGLPDPRAAGLTLKTVAGGFLAQSRDNARWVGQHARAFKLLRRPPCPDPKQRNSSRGHQQRQHHRCRSGRRRPPPESTAAMRRRSRSAPRSPLVRWRPRRCRRRARGRQARARHWAIAGCPRRSRAAQPTLDNHHAEPGFGDRERRGQAADPGSCDDDGRPLAHGIGRGAASGRGGLAEEVPRRVGFGGAELRPVPVERRAVGTHLLAVLAHVEEDVWVVEGRRRADAHEALHPDADDRNARIVLEMRNDVVCHL